MLSALEPVFLTPPVCGLCGEALVPLWDEAADEWRYVGPDGQGIGEDVERRADLDRAIELRERYLTKQDVPEDQLTWALEIWSHFTGGFWHTWHVHCPTGERTDGGGPWCCEQPMQWTGHGWRCRNSSHIT